MKVVEIFSIQPYILEIVQAHAGYYYYTIITPKAEVWSFGEIALTAQAAEALGRKVITRISHK